MFSIKKLRRWLALSFAGLFLFVTCSIAQATPKQTLTVGVEPVYAPFEFRAPNGEIQGFDIDIIRAIGQAAGFGVRFQNIAFDGLIPALQARTIDAAIGAMTITPERSQVVSFSRPYFKAGLAIAVPEGTQNVRTLDDLAGQAIAVQIGTTGADLAKDIPNAQIRTFNAAVLALQELKNGNVQAVINDAPVTLYAINTGNLEGIEVITDLVTEEFYGIPLPLNSPDLARVNQGLTTILDNGTYEQIYRKWFDAEPPALPDATQAGVSREPALGWFAVIVNSMPALLAGLVVTLQLALLSGILGLVGGCILGILRLSKSRPLRWLAMAYIDFFRGTPLLVQIFMIYFGLPALFQEFGIPFSLDRFLAAVIALSLNAAAYTGEIVRAGIQSIDKGQTEASQALGLSDLQSLRYVIFPQALRRMLPPLGNQFIALLKDTSLVAVIGFEELFRQGQLIVAENYRPFELYGAIAILYLILT
nr:ABC transporter permease subunit [Oculatellaceae cyanobacterium Prado106]